MYQEIINGYSPVGDIFLITMCVICAIIAHYVFLKKSKVTELFKLGVATLIVASSANVFTFLLASRGAKAVWILITRDIYHGCLLMLFVLFELYITVTVGEEKKKMMRIINVGVAINTIGFILDILSPFTGFGLHLENGVWIDPSWVKPFTITYVVNMVFIAALWMLRKNQMISIVRNVLILTQLIGGIIVLIESVMGHNSYTALTFAMPVIVVMILLHSNPYHLDTGALGGVPFDDYLHERTSKNKYDYMLCIRFETGNNFVMPQEVGKLFYNFYKGYFKDALLFNPSSECYVLAIKAEKNEDVEEKIHRLIEVDFQKNYEKYRIDYRGIVLQKAKIDSINNFLDMFFFFIFRNEKDTFTYISETEVKDYKRYRYISNQLHDIAEKGDLNDERVLAYCQPVYNVAEKRYDTGEILMRIKLPETGMVFPDEFIPLAEIHGYMHSLSMIILNKACQCIKELDSGGYDIQRLSVNFSIAELGISNFVEDYGKVVKDNGVSFSRIGVEFTESQNDMDYNRILDAAKKFKELGSVIYLDDFGTGYSNFDRILKLNADVIKFDKSILVLCEKDKAFRNLIIKFAEIFQSSGYGVLYEGIENDNYEQFCLGAYADYLQGYLYSRPIPVENMAAFLDENM